MARKTQQDNDKPVTVRELAIRIADAKDTDASVEAKKLRSRIRSNFDKLVPEWPGLSDSKENRDGNRYPPMPAALAEKLLSAATPTTSQDSDSK